MVAEDALVPKLTAISNNGYDQRIFVRGDKTVDYGRVMEVMGMLSAAGFTHIGLVTDVAKPKPDEQPKRPAARSAAAAPHHGAARPRRAGDFAGAACRR